MSLYFEELDFRPTPIGALSLRRRRELSLGVDVYEIKLDDEFLMSSLFTASEIALARLGLGELSGSDLDVVVGGLGLGYTAQAVLEHARVRSLVVVEAFSEVIEWHVRGLLPIGARLTSDPRSRLAHGDFFSMFVSSAQGLDPKSPGQRFHAILVDIDHSPRNVLHPSHAALYEPEGLRRLGDHLHPGGVFALWSNDPPDEDFNAALAQVFATSNAHIVSFHNPLQERDAASTVYVARTAAGKTSA
jgi:spermidine synthase